MGAPKGNQFWKLRSKHGRDKLFANAEMLWKAATEYFEWCDKNPFLLVEQLKTPTKPVKDTDGNYIFPPNTINLPRLRPYTIQGLSLYLNCNVQYFNDFEKAIQSKDIEANKDFSIIVSRIRETIYNQKFSGAAAGFLNPNIIARDLGLTEKKEVEYKSPIPITIIPDAGCEPIAD